MKNDILVVIANKIGESRSVFNKNNLYCFETLYNILKHNFSNKYEIPAGNFFDGAQNLKNDENKPVLYIMPECFDIKKKIFAQLISGGSAFFSCGKNKEIFACFDEQPAEPGSLARPQSGFNERFIDYSPVRNLRELRGKSIKAQKKIIAKLESSGVQFASLDGVCISPLAEISPGVIIYPGTIIKGESKIGADCVLGPDTLIENSQIGEACVINSAQIYSSMLENNIKIGPFCHIRPNCVIKSGVKIGDFVEVKNSTIGENSQASHLTYIGDSDVGERVNFGCGSVTVNYDGVKKARCNIEDDAFIGCNNNLIAPIIIGKQAVTAAGSTLTRDVPDNALAIARPREQIIKENWAELRNRAHKFNAERGAPDNKGGNNAGE